MVRNIQTFQRENRIKLIAQEWKALGCIDLDDDTFEEWVYEIQAKYGITRRLAMDYLQIGKTMAKMWIKEETDSLTASNKEIKPTGEQDGMQ